MTRTLLVTNDFPPKVGGIQSYLHELWRRLDGSSTCVLTASSHRDAVAFDVAEAQRGLRIDRVPERTLYLPSRSASRAVDRAIEREAPELVLYDPFMPLGLLASRGGVPFGVILHGAEVTVPARAPVLRRLSRSVLRRAAVAICAGSYPESEARRAAGGAMPAVLQVPPGVDTDRFVPLEPGRRAAVRAGFGLPADGPLVTCIGRLVPRKGVDVLIGAVARCSQVHPELTLAVAGEGRDAGRLRRLARRASARVHFLGRVSESDKVDLLGASDLFAQPCRTRWGGLEQEGFGIVFLEAAACAVPQIAGRSGGSFEAVESGTTGLVLDRPEDAGAVAAAITELLDDERLRAEMGRAARRRAEASFGYDLLARRLASGLDSVMGEPRPLRS